MIHHLFQPNFLLYYLISLLFFVISLFILYYIILYYINLRLSIISFFNLRSSIVLYLSSEGINLSLSIYSSFVSELFFGEVFETFVIRQRFYYQSNHQLFLLFFESLFLKQF